jgi:hypothetical protein
LQFRVDGKTPGATVNLDGPEQVTVKAKVTFARDIPLGTAVGGKVTGAKRLVEVVVNGKVAASKWVPADDHEHELAFSVPIKVSSWVALRNFPQLHTNPVNVLVAGRPIRASRSSAQWCAGCIEQLWRARSRAIAEAERPEAEATFQGAIRQYRALAREAPEGS